jgi:hypothetical protein
LNLDLNIYLSVSFSSSATDKADFSNQKIIFVIERIWILINESELLIADVKKSQCFYDLGIARTIGKNVIIITQNEDVPFELRHMPHIKCYDEEKGKVLLTEKLKIGKIFKKVIIIFVLDKVI